MGDRSNPLIPYPILHKLRQRLSPFGNNKLVIISRARIMILMNSPTREQIDWTKYKILEQVDAGIENIPLSNEDSVLKFARATVHVVVGRIDVTHALHYYDHLKEHGELDNIKGKDRIQCLFDYFYQCTELELATRYA